MHPRNRRSRQVSADAARMAEAVEMLDLLERDLAALIEDLKDIRLLLLALGPDPLLFRLASLARVEARIMALRHAQANT